MLNLHFKTANLCLFGRTNSTICCNTNFGCIFIRINFLLRKYYCNLTFSATIFCYCFSNVLLFFLTPIFILVFLSILLY